jgi:hypothetical protein
LLLKYNEYSDNLFISEMLGYTTLHACKLDKAVLVGKTRSDGLDRAGMAGGAELFIYLLSMV